MDTRLVAWARQVKARRLRGGGGGRGQGLPVLWMFTDWARAPDPLPAIAELPAGLCGVVFRHDAAPGRAVLLRQVARMCRARRTVLVVAGDPRWAAAAGAGVHLRNGWRGARRLPAARLVTSSAHDRISLLRAMRAGADAVFLSPLFPTASHPLAPALGPVRWSYAARPLPGRGGAGRGTEVYALGGVTGRVARRVPGRAGGAGAIGAAIPP